MIFPKADAKTMMIISIFSLIAINSSFETQISCRDTTLFVLTKASYVYYVFVNFRFVRLLDSVLHYIVPAWEYSVGSFSSLEVVRQFLPLSKKRNSLADHFLRQSETV